MLVAQDFLHGLCFFWRVLLQYFLAFASTSLHRLLLSLQKKETPGSVSAARGFFCLSNDNYYYYLGCRCLVLVAQDVLHSLCFLLVSLLQFFLAFGSGSLHRLQGLQKNKKHPGRTHKTTKGTQQCLGAGLSSEDCFWGGSLFLDPEAFIGY